MKKWALKSFSVQKAHGPIKWTNFHFLLLDKIKLIFPSMYFPRVTPTVKHIFSHFPIVFKIWHSFLIPQDFYSNFLFGWVFYVFWDPDVFYFLYVVNPISYNFILSLNYCLQLCAKYCFWPFLTIPNTGILFGAFFRNTGWYFYESWNYLRSLL